MIHIIYVYNCKNMIRTIENIQRIKYELGDNDSKILNRLADEIEGLCGTDGMILPGTTELVSRTPPFLNKIENGGLIETIVKYRAKTVTISQGTKLRVKITNENRIGPMSVYMVDDHIVATVLLPYDLQPSSSKDVLLKDHYVDVTVLGIQYGTGWKTMNAVGRVDDTMIKTTNIRDTRASNDVAIETGW